VETQTWHGCAQAALAALKQGAHLSALLIALRLKDARLLRDVIMATPADEVGLPSGCSEPTMEAVRLPLAQHYLRVYLFLRRWGVILLCSDSKAWPGVRSCPCT
jgi:hypothetical protein